MLDVKALLAKILTGKQNMLSTQTFTSAQQTLNANADLNNSLIDITRSGYKAIGIVGYTIVWVSGTTNLINIVKVELYTSTQARFTCRNIGTAQAKFRMQVCVLYEKV